MYWFDRFFPWIEDYMINFYASIKSQPVEQ